MEAMMREIREGTKYCSSGCASGTLSFTNKDGDAVKYEWDETEKYIKRTKGSDESLRMTSDGIKIISLSFLVKGNGAGTINSHWLRYPLEENREKKKN